MVHTIKQSDPKGMHFIWFTPTSCSRAESQRPFKQSNDIDIIPVRSKTEGVDKDLAVNVDEGLQGGHVHLAEDIAKLVILIFKDFNIFRIFLKKNKTSFSTHTYSFNWVDSCVWALHWPLAPLCGPRGSPSTWRGWPRPPPRPEASAPPGARPHCGSGARSWDETT